jgi:hypothetical protein
VIRPVAVVVEEYKENVRRLFAALRLAKHFACIDEDDE